MGVHLLFFGWICISDMYRHPKSRRNLRHLVSTIDQQRHRLLNSLSWRRGELTHCMSWRRGELVWVSDQMVQYKTPLSKHIVGQAQKKTNNIQDDPHHFKESVSTPAIKFGTCLNQLQYIPPRLPKRRK